MEIVQQYRHLSKIMKESLEEELYKMTGDAPVFSKSEALENNVEEYWLYEGLCGEKNIISGLPFFSISLTWIERDTAQTCVIYDPINDDVFCTTEGMGAQINNKRLRLLELDHIDMAFTNKMIPLLDKVGFNSRIIGSSELEVAWLCSGKAQMCCYTQTDLSPGQRLFVKESGGTCFEIEHEGMKLVLIGYKRSLIQFMERAGITK
jgi:fructose-1,6-bisphosphatase/inositol monophosphatase family enzyme